MGKWGTASAVVLAALTTIGTAHGQAPGERPAVEKRAEQAKVLFRTGFDLWAAGDKGKACGKFSASWELHPTVGAGLNVGRCQLEFEGKAAAYDTFVKVADLAQRTSDGREGAARDLAAELVTQLCILHISASLDVNVTLDDKPLGQSAKPFQLTVDPGSHDIVASADDHLPFSQTIECKPEEATEHRVDVPPLVSSAADPRLPAGPVPGGPAPNTPSTEPPDPVPHDAPDSGPLMPLGFAVGSVGVGLAIVGAVFGSLATSDRDEALALCPNMQCNVDDAAGIQGREKVGSAQDKALVSTVGIAAGLGLTAAGVTMLILDAVGSDSAVVPLVDGTTHQAGVLFVGRF